MYQPCGNGTFVANVIAPVLLTAAASEGVAKVVNVTLSGLIAIVQEAIVFVAAPTSSSATVIARDTGLTLAVPEAHAPVFGNAPDVIGGAGGIGCTVESVKVTSPEDLTSVPSAL